MTLRPMSCVAGIAVLTASLGAKSPQQGVAAGQTTPPPSAGPSAGRSTDPLTGLVVGRLLDGTTDRPLAGLVVVIEGGTTNRDNQDFRRVITDSGGRFLFRQLSAGEYAFSIV